MTCKDRLYSKHPRDPVSGVGADLDSGVHITALGQTRNLPGTGCLQHLFSSVNRLKLRHVGCSGAVYDMY